MNQFLRISEFYTSLQGEGKHAGLACFFIRTAGCDLRCSWCDTPQALKSSDGRWASLEELLGEIPDYVPLIQITGGEPLLQKDRILTLTKVLSGSPHKKKVLLETGGHLSIDGIPSSVHIVMDVKLPDSGEDGHDFSRNFPHLKASDEIKFVLASRNDFNRALEWIREYNLTDACQLLMSPVWGRLDIKELASWILEEKLRARMQIQLHKYIWGANTQGV